MKKLIALILVTVFAFSLVGCGGVSVDTSSPEGAVIAFIKESGNIADLEEFTYYKIRYTTNIISQHSNKTGKELEELMNTYVAEIGVQHSMSTGLNPINIFKAYENKKEHIHNNYSDYILDRKIRFDSVEVDYDKEVSIDDFLEKYCINSAEDCVHVNYTVTYIQMGKEDEKISSSKICVKIDGKWYVLLQ